jgi:hypothetical protein
MCKLMNPLYVEGVFVEYVLGNYCSCYRGNNAEGRLDLDL